MKKLILEEFDLPLEDGSSEEFIDKIAKEKEDHCKEVKKDLEARVKTGKEVSKSTNVKYMEEKLVLPEEDPINEEVVDEAIPRDLANVYRRGPHRVGGDTERLGYKDIKYHTYTDFQNSEYQEITPEEALQMRKDGQADKIRVIFDGQLVTFDPDGKQIHKAERSYGSDRDKYTRENGFILDSTRKFTFKQVVSNADKIYVADERSIPFELQKERSANPESRYFDIHTTYPDNSYSDVSRDLTGHPTSRNSIPSSGYGYNDRDLALRRRNRDKAAERVKVAQADLDSASSDTERDYRQSRLDREKRNLDYENNTLKDYHRRYKDALVNQTSFSSNMDLRKVFASYNNLKSAASDTSYRLSQAKDRLDTAKDQGSPEVRRHRENIQNLENQIRDMKRRIAEYQVYLADADEMNQAEIDARQAEFDNLTDTNNAIRSKIDRLLRRSPAGSSEGGEQ